MTQREIRRFLTETLVWCGDMRRQLNFISATSQVEGEQLNDLAEEYSRLDEVLRRYLQVREKGGRSRLPH